MSRLLVIALLLSAQGIADARSHGKKHGHVAHRGKANKAHSHSAKAAHASAMAVPPARAATPARAAPEDQAVTSTPPTRTAMVPQASDDEVPGRRR